MFNGTGIGIQPGDLPGWVWVPVIIGIFLVYVVGAGLDAWRRERERRPAWQLPSPSSPYWERVKEQVCKRPKLLAVLRVLARLIRISQPRHPLP
jgi:hypothetical protein